MNSNLERIISLSMLPARPAAAVHQENNMNPNDFYNPPIASGISSQGPMKSRNSRIARISKRPESRTSAALLKQNRGLSPVKEQLGQGTHSQGDRTKSREKQRRLAPRLPSSQKQRTSNRAL